MTMDTGSASAPAVVQPADAPKPHPSKMPSVVSPQAPASTMASPMKVAQALMSRHGEWLKSASLSDWASKHRGALTGTATGGALAGALAYAVDKARGPDPSDPDAPFWTRRPPVWLHALNGAMAGNILGSMADDNRRARDVLNYVREATKHMRQQQKQAALNTSFISRNRGALTGALTGAAGGGLMGAAAGAYAQQTDPKNNPNGIRNGVTMGLLGGAAMGGLAGHGMGRPAKPPPAISPPGASSSWYDAKRHPEKLRRVWDTVVGSSELKDPAAAQRAQDFLNQVGSPNMDVGAVTQLRDSFPQDSHTRQLFNILMNHHVKTAALSDTLRRYGFSV